MSPHVKTSPVVDWSGPDEPWYLVAYENDDGSTGKFFMCAESFEDAHKKLDDFLVAGRRIVSPPRRVLKEDPRAMRCRLDETEQLLMAMAYALREHTAVINSEEVIDMFSFRQMRSGVPYHGPQVDTEHTCTLLNVFDKTYPSHATQSNEEVLARLRAEKKREPVPEVETIIYADEP